jgi:outer membrane biosynthesis protein TonB
MVWANNNSYTNVCSGVVNPAMREKLLTCLGILLIVTLLMVCIDENAIAKNNHKNPTPRPVPTIIPVPDPENPSNATPTPSPTPVPDNTPTPSPAPVPETTPTPETTPVPVSAPVSQQVPIDVLYNMQPRWPVFNTTPVPTEAPLQKAAAVLSMLSDDPTPVPSPLVTDIELTRPGVSPGVIISALMGFACIGYLAYLGYVMIRR